MQSGADGLSTAGKVSLAVAVIPILWRIVSAIFGLVSRKELLAALEGQRKRHEELVGWMQRLDERVGKVEMDVAALRGVMAGRHQALMEEGRDDRA